VWRDQHGRVLPDQHDLASTDGGTGGGTGGEVPDRASTKIGFRTHGKSKDSRDDLPQVVVGMAVTRDGIPVRVWCWPGNTSDSPLIRQVKDELRDWTLGQVIWVADRGFASAENRRHLAAGADGYILGEKLRSGSPEAAAALSRPGRYQLVADNMRVKEVKVSAHERFVICHNPHAADRDAATRTRLVERLEAMIEGSDTLGPTKRSELQGVISTRPGLHRFLRTTPSGLLRIDAAAVAADAKLDGKYLLRTSDPRLSAEDIARGYKQLLEVERGWRDMKQILDLRPVFHRLEDRIRAHVLLCWLALLLIRVVETRTSLPDGTSTSWPRARDTLQRLHVGVFTGPAGTFRQTTDPTAETRRLHTTLGLPLPPRILHLDTATTR
jgi:transposase